MLLTDILFALAFGCGNIVFVMLLVTTIMRIQDWRSTMPSTIHAEPYREAVLSTYVGTTFNACGTEWQVQAIDEMRPADSFTTIVRFSFCDTRYGEHVYTAINLDEVFETGEMVNVSPVIHYGIDRFITELPRFKVNKWKQKYDKVVI